MDGVSLSDLPMIALIVGGFALFAGLVLWLPKRLPFLRAQALVIWAVIALYAVAALASKLVGQVPLRVSDFGLVAMAAYFLIYTWRRRDLA